MTPPARPASRHRVGLCLFALVAMLGLGTSPAGAVGPAPETENFIAELGESGSAAGQFSSPGNIAANSTTGHIYIADSGNARISEFTPWGNFVRAFGWGVADGTSEALQTCTTICFKGLEGTGAGEFRSPYGVVVDLNGDVYVRESEYIANWRVQKFSSSGQFLLTFGGEVDKTQVHKREEEEAKSELVTVTAEDEDICTAVSGDQCGAGISGTAHGEFSGGSNIALSPEGQIIVADKDRIEEFEPDGVYRSEVGFPNKAIGSLGVDPKNGDLYLTFGGEQNVDKFSPTGASLGTLAVALPGYITVDYSGNVYVFQGSVIETNFTSGNEFAEFDATGKRIGEFDVPAQRPDQAEVNGLGVNTLGDLYVSNYSGGFGKPPASFVSAYGPGPLAFEPPPKVPPTVESEYVLSSDRDSAIVQAQINPHFWSDTTYYVQYGTGDCEVGGCASQPAAPGSKLTGIAVAAPVTSGGVLLSGLQPGATYHYRFVAEGSGGGPVFGPDKTVTTFPPPTPNFDCPNQAYRNGFSGLLTDCRAYEMVSPVEKDNSDVLALPDFGEVSTSIDQSAIGGEKFTYSSYRAFGDAESAPFSSQYIASRDPVKGWLSEAISPLQRPDKSVAAGFETEYRLFSPDLSSAWMLLSGEPALAPGAVEGFRTLYRRDNESDELEALTKVRPPTQEPGGHFEPELQGVSTDGSRMVFRANDKLTPDASSEKEIFQLYEYDSHGGLRLLSVLPDGNAASTYSSAGTVSNSLSFDLLSNITHAVSDDGSRIYWSETNGYGALGKIYLREDVDQEQSVISGGECTEPEKACTVDVSSKASRFWTASPDGSKALYTIAEGARKEELDEFDAEEATSTRIAGKVQGLLGTSEDLSYIYFVSTEALVPGAQTGQPNLYVRHGATRLIGTFSSNEEDYSASPVPVQHAARVTSDGRHLAFVSATSLTGYDNVDAVSGKPDLEVYTYDAGSGQLNCVSCDRSGARPAGSEVEIPSGGGTPWTAASIPGWENEFYASRALSDSGDRLFFDSYVALVPRDTNGKEDVYEWEAVGSGDCTADSSAFSVSNGGCVSLTSSGESPQDSEFVDASPNGDDVFFGTAASLLPQDPGLVDIYDARVDGGFPAPAAPPASCEGEACQGSAASPQDATPASASFSGPGNLVPALTAAMAPEASVKVKGASERRGAALAKTLRACRAKARFKRRKSCEAAARKRYRAKPTSLAGKSNKRGK